MFNLLMRYTAWNEGRDSIAVDRCFEYTRDDLRDRYRQGNNFLLDELIRFPCLFMEEGSGPEIARVGRIIEARVENREIHFEYTLEPGIPVILNSQIYANRRDFSMPQDFEFSRGHWAIKDVDLYRAILRIGRPQRQRPRAFTLPEQENIAELQVSVMMPFDGRFRAVYDAIEAMARRNGLRCNRADNIWENDHVIQDVVNLIDRSRIVICDLSERNPNVFYEVGIAHTLGREVILITQNRNDVPFDLQGIRNVHYLNNDQGIEELVRQLETRIHDIYAA